MERNPDFAATLTIPDIPDESAKILHNLPQPDFDDTGFMGREKELSALKKALVGNYPVVTVVGEGGLGKTALALKACYDILDDNRAGLDAIVWTSAKTTRLTVNEVQLIEGAITSSMGIIESATAPLGRQTGTQAIDDLLEHMANNKILLVIDNLETVIDQNITYLVSHLPAGSRILFTTRIGLGAFDFPISLEPLNKRDAAQYFRAAARVFGVNDLARQPATVVEEYCTKLHYNTLFIKWFLLSVKVGKRPTVIMNNPAEFLQFCLQNVFSGFSTEAKTIARILANVAGKQTLASLCFYTELDSVQVQSSLSTLITSNLVTGERGRNTEDEDRYSLSSLARAYIQKFLRMELDEQRRLIVKQNELRSAQEQMAALAGLDIFDMNSVFVRSKEDYIVAKILTKAIDKIFKRDLEGANVELEKAEDLSPNYFEVKRVKAFMHVISEDYLWRTIVTDLRFHYASQRAPLRMWYGGFLSRNIGDQERALEELFEAEKLAEGSVPVKLECARVLQYLRRFDEAEQRLISIKEIEKQPGRVQETHLEYNSTK